MNAYAEDREKLMRRAAAGENVHKQLEQLDEAQVSAERQAAFSADLEKTRQVIGAEERAKQIQIDHDAAVEAFKDLQAKASNAADAFEALLEKTKAALLEWQIAQQAAQAQATQVHHFQQQGARRVPMPVAFSGADYSIHLLRHAGKQFHQQILHNSKLPRIV